jgi:hypothetical protein
MRAFILFVLVCKYASCNSSHSSRMCHSSNHSYSNGIWKYFGPESSDFKRCPKASMMFRATEKYRNQIATYSCLNYTAAVYSPHNCKILPLSRSLHMISSRMQPGAITFVGDSLMCQQFMAASCDFEILNQSSDHLRPVYINDVFLRPDIPCEDICITNETYREANIRSFPARCSGILYILFIFSSIYY